MINKIKKDIEESINVQSSIILNDTIFEKMYQSALEITNCFKNNGKVYICGNGGSAAESMHFSAELLGRFKLERKALPIFSLNADSTVITAIANDYGYDYVFSRQLHGIIQKHDILIVLSTSGNSNNVLYALEEATKNGCTCICFLGQHNGKIQTETSIVINIPSKHTPRIQECQLLLLHILCDIVEQLIMQKL